MREVLGSCPKCGGLFVTGKYGPYCGEKCGFRLGKIFGEELTDEEAKSLISGEDLYLSRTSKNSGNAYGIIVKLSDIREYPFTRKDGSIGSYFYPDVAFRFPDREEERKRTSEKEDRSATDPESLMAAGAEEMPF